MIFTARPNGAADVVETLGYLTNVMTARDLTEQRTQLRALHTRSLRFNVTAGEGVDVAQALAQVFAIGSDLVSVPWWPDANRISAAAASGSSALYFPTTGRFLGFSEDVLLWRDQWTYEVVNVAFLYSDHIDTTDPLVASWPIYSVAVPLKVARILTAPNVSYLNGQVASFEVEFSWELP